MEFLPTTIDRIQGSFWVVIVTHMRSSNFEAFNLDSTGGRHEVGSYKNFPIRASEIRASDNLKSKVVVSMMNALRLLPD